MPLRKGERRVAPQHRHKPLRLGPPRLIQERLRRNEMGAGEVAGLVTGSQQRAKYTALTSNSCALRSSCPERLQIKLAGKMQESWDRGETALAPPVRKSGPALPLLIAADF